MEGSVQRYLSVDETCQVFGICRSTFYEMVRKTDLDEIIVRIPPSTGRIRVPSREFEQWLKRNK